MKIELTSGWPFERIATVWPDVLRCLQLFVNRFPTDETMENIVTQVIDGRLQLWLIDDAGAIVMAVLTHQETNTATGKRTAHVYALGGERGADVMPCLLDIEAWARAGDFDEMEISGRTGWRKRLQAQGWHPALQVYRKPLKG